MSTVELEHEVRTLSQRIDQLEKAIVQLTHEMQRSSRIESPDSHIETTLRPEAVDEQDLRAWMREQGLIIEPPQAAIEHSRRWRAVSAAERRALQRELDHMPPGVMVSELIIEGRN